MNIFGIVDFYKSQVLYSVAFVTFPKSQPGEDAGLHLHAVYVFLLSGMTDHAGTPVFRVWG